MIDNRASAGVPSSGPIPPELGSLTNLIIAYLYSNQLWGEVPLTPQNLVNLAELLLFGQSGCLTAANPASADWLAGFDPNTPVVKRHPASMAFRFQGNNSREVYFIWSRRPNMKSD